MYQYRNNNRNNQNRFRGNNSRFQRKVKSFDPSNLVRNIEPTVTEDEPYIATNSFTNLAISDILKENIAARGYTTPTPIQDKTIPLILENRDVIGIANTGTGKTAAFLIPLINKTFVDRSRKVLIIAPTRELTVQIKDEFMQFSRRMNLHYALLIGGASIYNQKNDLRRNPNFVIGTPGRIKDLINQRILNLSSFNIVVLDEVDQMVDIGFIGDIKYFISLLDKNRQSLFFSATVDEKVKGIINSFVTDPITVSVKKQDIIKNIKHEVIKISDKKRKVDELHDLLIKKEFQKVLIFARTKRGVQRLSDELKTRGFNANVIHGNKSQFQRLQILSKFKNDNLQILLATDIASRGLDINNVTHVINYDPPESYEVYIHRIGRTGRADKYGTAITFI